LIPYRSILAGIIALFAAVAFAAQVHAETGTIRVAQQFGISYLPLIVAKEKRLIEISAARVGLAEPKVEWLTLSGAAIMNEALISGNLDIASAGIAPLITAWAKTRGTAKIIGLAALCSMPSVLTTINPAIKTLADFTENDRIALPAVKIGFQPQVLQMAAAQQLGRYDKLDSITVSMPHPDATASLLSGKSEITSHFTSPPFVQQQLKDARIHKVLSSYEVLGGPHTFNVAYSTERFVQDNPKTSAAFIAALDEADTWIGEHPAEAARLYIAAEQSKLDPAFIEAIIRDPENRFTTVPEKAEIFASFQYRVGLIKVKPGSWRDLFQPALQDKPGS